MVESVGAKPVGQTIRIAAAAPVAQATSVAGRAQAEPTDRAQTSGLARSMAASAPVDADRVARIKKAIADGKFPILPATIADRLIALKLEWHPSEADHDAA